MWSAKRPILIITLICAVVAAVCSAGAARTRGKPKYPTAFELLDKFAATQDKLKSFVAKGEGSSKVYTFSDNKPEYQSYSTFDCRVDGKRAYSRTYAWGDINPTMHLTKDKAYYASHLWDGKDYYAYNKAKIKKEFSKGTVFLLQNAEDKQRPRRTSTFKYFPGSSAMGHLRKTVERIDTIIRKADSVRVRDKMEKIGDSDCYVIEAKARTGDYTVWIDPAHGYNIAKAELRIGPGDVSAATGYVLPENDSSFTFVKNVRFKKIGDLWVPIEADIVIGRHKLNSRFNNTTSSHCKITEIELNPDHDTLGSFVPDDILNGARVRLFEVNDRIPGRYTWQDGKVVDKEGKVVLDCILKKPAGSAESKPKSAVRKRPSAWELLRKYATQKAKVTAPRSKERVVHFPKDRDLGRLKLRDDTDFEVENFGFATGDVTVPAGKRLILFVGRNAWKDLSHLAELEPDDLYSVTLSGSYQGGAKPGDYYLRHFAGLTGLKVLHLSNTKITYKGLRHLKQLKSLNYLELSSGGLGDRALPHIAELTSLETLVFGSSVTDDGLRDLAPLNNLKQLVIWVNDIRGPGLRHLAELPNLDDLFLRGTKYGGKCKFTDSSLRYLKDVKSLRKIRFARGLQITDAGIAHLSKLAGLEGLDLYGHPITNAGLAHLKSLNSLKDLDLRKTKISSGALMQLRQMKSLEYLKLPSSVTDSMTDADMAYLGELDKLRCLHVGFGDGRITDAGLSHVAKLHRLVEFSITGKNITDAGMSHIAKLTNLRFLKLSTDQVTDEGLAKLTTLKSLKKLYIYRANMSTSGLAHLNELPNLTELIVKNIKQDSKPLNISGLVSLKSLRLGFERDLGPRDEDLACLGKLTRLKVLGISPHKGITDKGLQHLAGLTNIWMLSVGSDKVTDDGLAHLANMQKLSNLTLSGNFTDIGLRHLEKLEALAVLDFMSGANFTPRSLNQFRKKMPHLGLLRDYGKSRKQRPKSRR